ncbi:hypothetical protein ANANG_G00252320 [Anguilla anguilla]|uniref:Uncharacterized protein n=1 Tax=Anguilla anguilla TaxID=7936 RepID=A0A9D3LSM1_ANGAN|nr:hypothetical protein ANANG_G00252320 [Anguilla anguilla]
MRNQASCALLKCSLCHGSKEIIIDPTRRNSKQLHTKRTDTCLGQVKLVNYCGCQDRRRTEALQRSTSCIIFVN